MSAITTPTTTSVSDDALTVAQQAQKKVEERHLAKTDKLYLAVNVLGMTAFTSEVHGELFGQYIPYDSAKAWTAQSDIKNRLTLWPRGHLKTSSIVVEIISMILNFPDSRILLMQSTIKNSKGLLRQIASHFSGEAFGSRLNELFPEFCGTRKALKLNAESFTTPARVHKQLPQATVSVASPKSVKTGQHYDAGFFDDLVTAENAHSSLQLEKVERDFTMCIPLIDPGGYKFVTGTRYVFGDPYENIIRRDQGVNEWKISVKTCWSDDGLSVRFPQFKASDGSTHGFTLEQLLAIQKNEPALFASQYLNEPAIEGTQPFPEHLLLSSVCAEQDTPALSQATLFIDLATGGTEHSDDAVILVPKIDSQGRIYIIDGRGGQWGVPETAIQVIDMALKHRPLRVYLEKSAAGQVFVEYLKVIARDKSVVLPIEFLPANNTKDAKRVRILALEGLLKSKRLFFFAGLSAIWAKLLEQFKQFPRGRHDDYPDTVALIAQHFGAKFVPLFAVQQPAPSWWTQFGFDRLAEEQQTPVTQITSDPQDSFRDNMLGSDFVV